MKFSRIFQGALALGLVAGGAAYTEAQTQTATTTGQSKQPLIYPAKGQSRAQTEKDVTACKGWAQQQTGFDPEVALAQQESQTPAYEGAPPRGGAGRGAATGAAIGAIAGDAGKGAAAGAAAGTVRRRSDIRQQEAAEQQQQQAQETQVNQELAEYNRAMTACLEGRGYTVQ